MNILTIVNLTLFVVSAIAFAVFFYKMYKTDDGLAS
jgi:hypothetical protein